MVSNHLIKRVPEFNFHINYPMVEREVHCMLDYYLKGVKKPSETLPKHQPILVLGFLVQTLIK